MKRLSVLLLVLSALVVAFAAPAQAATLGDAEATNYIHSYTLEDSYQRVRYVATSMGCGSVARNYATSAQWVTSRLNSQHVYTTNWHEWYICGNASYNYRVLRVTYDAGVYKNPTGTCCTVFQGARWGQVIEDTPPSAHK